MIIVTDRNGGVVEIIQALYITRHVIDEFCAVDESRQNIMDLFLWRGTATKTTTPATAGDSKQPLSSPGRTALHGRSKKDFSLGEESAITRTWAMDDKPDKSDIGQTILSKKGDEAGKHITCIGFSAHWVSQDEADDFDLVGPSGGGFESHWSVTKYYRLATEEEAAPVKARRAAKREREEIRKEMSASYSSDTHLGYEKPPEIDMTELLGDHRMAGSETWYLGSDGVVYYMRSDYDMGPSWWKTSAKPELIRRAKELGVKP